MVALPFASLLNTEMLRFKERKDETRGIRETARKRICLSSVDFTHIWPLPLLLIDSFLSWMTRLAPTTGIFCAVVSSCWCQPCSCATLDGACKPNVPGLLFSVAPVSMQWRGQH